MIPTKCTYWNHPLYLPQLFFESHLLCKCRQLCLEQDVQRALYACPLQRESRFPHCNIVGSLISSGKRFYRTLFSILWLGKVILGDSKANSFPSISYVCQEEVVVVTACFVTPKTHLGSLGVSPFLQPPVCFQWLSRLHTSPAGRNQRYSHIPIFPYSHIPIFPYSHS